MRSYKTTILRCPNCGLEFYGEYGHGGAIEHNNIISNIDVYISRYASSKYDNDRLFSELVNLGGNDCMHHDHTYVVGMQIYECILGALSTSGELGMYLWFKGKRKDVVCEYIKKREYVKSLAVAAADKEQEYIDTLVEIKGSTDA